MRLSSWQEEINYRLRIQPGSFCGAGKGEGWGCLGAKITQNNLSGEKKPPAYLNPQPLCKQNDLTNEDRTIMRFLGNW